MRCLTVPPLCGGDGQIKYVAILIIGLEHSIPDPETELTTEDMCNWIVRMILFNSGLNLYQSQGGLGDYIDCFKFHYPHYFGKEPFQVFLPPKENHDTCNNY